MDGFIMENPIKFQLVWMEILFWEGQSSVTFTVGFRIQYDSK